MGLEIPSQSGTDGITEENNLEDLWADEVMIRGLRRLRVLVVEGESPGDPPRLQCPHCPCSLAKRQGMRIHLRSVHAKDPHLYKHRCPHCETCCTSAWKLKRHLARHERQRRKHPHVKLEAADIGIVTNPTLPPDIKFPQTIIRPMGSSHPSDSYHDDHHYDGLEVEVSCRSSVKKGTRGSKGGQFSRDKRRSASTRRLVKQDHKYSQHTPRVKAPTNDTHKYAQTPKEEVIETEVVTMEIEGTTYRVMGATDPNTQDSQHEGEVNSALSALVGILQNDDSQEPVVVTLANDSDHQVSDAILDYNSEEVLVATDNQNSVSDRREPLIVQDDVTPVTMATVHVGDDEVMYECVVDEGHDAANSVYATDPDGNVYTADSQGNLYTTDSTGVVYAMDDMSAADLKNVSVVEEEIGEVVGVMDSTGELIYLEDEPSPQEHSIQKVTKEPRSPSHNAPKHSGGPGQERVVYSVIPNPAQSVDIPAQSVDIQKPSTRTTALQQPSKIGSGDVTMEIGGTTYRVVEAADPNTQHIQDSEIKSRPKTNPLHSGSKIGKAAPRKPQSAPPPHKQVKGGKVVTVPAISSTQVKPSVRSIRTPSSTYSILKPQVKTEAPKPATANKPTITRAKAKMNSPVKTSPKIELVAGIGDTTIVVTQPKRSQPQQKAAPSKEETQKPRSSPRRKTILMKK